MVVGVGAEIPRVGPLFYFFSAASLQRKKLKGLQLDLTSTSTLNLDTHPKSVSMVRKLKYHEQKLLRKTDFITYKQDNGHRDKAVMRRYMIQKPEDYHKINRICGVRFSLTL